MKKMKNFQIVFGLIVFLILTVACQNPFERPTSGTGDISFTLIFDSELGRNVSQVQDFGGKQLSVEIRRNSQTGTPISSVLTEIAEPINGTSIGIPVTFQNVPTGVDLVLTARVQDIDPAKTVYFTGTSPVFQANPNSSAPVVLSVVKNTFSPDAKNITSFWFRKSLNSILTENIQGNISLTGNQGVIQITIPESPLGFNLIPSFAHTGTKVEVNGVVQTSSVTSQNFGNNVTYRVFDTQGGFLDYTLEIEGLEPVVIPPIAQVYVDGVLGDDANDGDIDNPLKTITMAVSRVETGGTIHIRSGSYAEPMVTLNKNVTVIGSYSDGDFITRSLTPPLTILETQGTDQDFEIGLSVTGGTVILDGLTIQPPQGVNHTYGLGISGAANVEFLNGRIDILPTTTTAMTIRGINRGTGSGNLLVKDTEIKLGGNSDFYGIWIPGSLYSSGWVTLEGVHINTIGNPDAPASGIVKGNNLVPVAVQNNGNLTLTIRDSIIEGSIDSEGSGTTELKSIDMGNSPNNSLIVENTRFYELYDFTGNDNRAHSAIRISTGLGSLVVQDSEFYMSSSTDSNLWAIGVNDTPSVVIRNNQIRISSRTASGSGYGISIEGTPTLPNTLIANNVIELMGTGVLWSYGIRTMVPDSKIVNNTIVISDTFTGSANGIVITSGTGIEIANNIVVNNSVNDKELVKKLPSVSLYTNLLYGNFLDDIVSMNTQGSGNFTMNPMLNTGTMGTNLWYNLDSTYTPAFVKTAGVPDYTTEVPTDINGVSRTVDFVSLGAYQENGSALLGELGPTNGYIFYDNPDYELDGWRFLEAASTDILNIQWSAPAIDVPAAINTTIGSGSENTDTILTALASQTNMAAHEAKALTQGGMNDWFLPSEGELYQMFSILKQGGIGGFAEGAYWSSTNLNLTQARSIIFEFGDLSAADKTIGYNVRPVRRF